MKMGRKVKATNSVKTRSLVNGLRAPESMVSPRFGLVSGIFRHTIPPTTAMVMAFRAKIARISSGRSNYELASSATRSHLLRTRR